MTGRAVLVSSLLSGALWLLLLWVAAWLLAVAVWTWILSWSPWPEALLVGASIASLCFAGWQLLALVLRAPLALRVPRS